MFFNWLLIFITIPLVELALLLKIGSLIGPGATFVLVIMTGVIGASMARSQGFSVLRKIQSELASNRIPASELIDGLLVLIGGIVLLTPGIMTDLLGFSLLHPGFRSIWKNTLKKKFVLVTASKTPVQPTPENPEDVIDV
ncbi:MAG TPA: FxsA family protein [Verrucomicrobiales bacterium]|jgi:UPF0716 protein FxsA|nr:FxsA family protein [Verrucomicrobiales bacterium]HIL71318.1 FxsA family protein [Verrucomicrobiota bacterium]